MDVFLCVTHTHAHAHTRAHTHIYIYIYLFIFLGGHINPAVTLTLCIIGRCPWIQMPIYWIGQYLGAMAGSAVVFGVYYRMYCLFKTILCKYSSYFEVYNSLLKL